MVDISIIIVSWNARKDLLSCLQSIRDTASSISLEVIVVDNGSSDGSPEATARDYPEVLLVQTGANLGFATGNNIGINRSRGRYLCLINSDVILDSGCLHEMLAFMDREPQCGMAGPKILNFDRTLQATCRRLPSLRDYFFQALFLDKIFPNTKWFPSSYLSPEEHTEFCNMKVLVGCFWFVRRAAFDEVGGLDERFFMYCEDDDWCKRFGDAGWRILYHPHASAIHVGGRSSSNQPVRFLLENEKARILYWRKHKGFLGGISYCAIMFLSSTLRLILHAFIYCFQPSRRKLSLVKIKQAFARLRWLFHL